MLRQFITIIALTVFAAFMVSADDTAPKADAKAPAAPKELKNQTHCPVMGGKIDSTVFTDIQGQRVYHCCPMCSSKLGADPDKYFEKAASEGVLFENIQTICPVSGEELKDKSVYTDYKGRRIAFCCEKCPDLFSKAPDKYLKMLDESAKTEADTEAKPHKKMEMDHSGHNH